MVSSPAIHFKCLAFDELSSHQLYELMALRQAVFVVEQNCPYLDADGKDLEAYHVLAYDDHGSLVAYTRLMPPGLSYAGYASIGRVANAASVRGTGIGRKLLQESLQEIERLFGAVPVKISAQTYLLRFYESFGFEAVGATYLEDDIPHIAMIRKA